jgi:hypothetical protein
MEHGEAPGVASLLKGQALFLARLWSAVTGHRFGTKVGALHGDVLLLLNLDIC